jgi:Ca2+-binding EF-hand superfamily protein
MKAFGMEIKKQDVRDIYAEMGKDIKEGLSFNEFQTVMTSRMVKIFSSRGLETLKTKY